MKFQRNANEIPLKCIGISMKCVGICDGISMEYVRISRKNVEM